MKHFLICTLVLLTLCTMSYGQKKFSKVTPEDFKTPAEAVDTSVAAVCIYDIGNSNFRATSSHFFIDTEVKVRMHILTERGREYANKSISYYSSLFCRLLKSKEGVETSNIEELYDVCVSTLYNDLATLLYGIFLQ